MLFFVNDDTFPQNKAVINIRRDRCDGCAICIDTCPTHALKIIQNKERKGPRRHRIVFVDPKLCEGCGICQATCPKESLFIPGLAPDQIRNYITQGIKDVRACMALV